MAETQAHPPQRTRNHGAPSSPPDARSASQTPPGAPARLLAAAVVHGVRDQGRSLTALLAAPVADLSAADQALVQEMAYGTLRVLPRLEAVANCLLKRPLKPRDRDLEALILVGLYQLSAMQTPAHAAVSATVEASRLLGKDHQAALVNALLRRFLRERDTLLDAVAAQARVRWLVPDWIRIRLQADWPHDWERILTASNSRAPMNLRVNRMRIGLADYATQLAAAGLSAQAISDCPAGLRLAHPCPMRDLPGFAAGLVSVQDSGAQLAAELLDAQPGQRVLDACAAPGGKTAAILERVHGALDLLALDQDATRLRGLQDQLTRLGLTAQVAVADICTPGADWAAAPFERILLDVPCSALGVIRRHPDIKWLRRESDIPALAATQTRMLDSVWPLLAAGGRLLYATCSLLHAENSDQIAAFLARHPDAREIALPDTLGVPCRHGRQLLPCSDGSDGFYYALLTRVVA